MPPKWTLVARRNAFNGTILWKQSIPTDTATSGRSRWPDAASRVLVATVDCVCDAGAGKPVTAIGRGHRRDQAHVPDQTTSTEEVLHENSTLYLLVNRQKLDLASYAPSNAVVGDQGRS